MFTITFKYETVEFFWVYVWDVIFKQRFSTPQFVRVLPRKIESVGSISVGTTSSDELPYEYSDEATSCQPFVRPDPWSRYKKPLNDCVFKRFRVNSDPNQLGPCYKQCPSWFTAVSDLVIV